MTAISGAAVSPLMGAATRHAYRILFTFTNVCLGVWLPHPKVVHGAREQLNRLGDPGKRKLLTQLRNADQKEDKKAGQEKHKLEAGRTSIVLGPYREDGFGLAAGALPAGASLRPAGRRSYLRWCMSWTTMTTPETSRKRATTAMILMATRQNATQATARAMKKGIIRFPHRPGGGAALVHGHRGGVGYCLLHRSGYDVCHHWTFVWIRVPVLSTVDGPTSAVLFVYAVR